MSTVDVQISDSLHKSLQQLAKREGISIDQFIATSVAEKIAALLTAEYRDQRGERFIVLPKATGIRRTRRTPQRQEAPRTAQNRGLEMIFQVHEQPA